MNARQYQIAGWVALVALAAWLLRPILTPAHVEGFSASIVSLALHLNAGDMAGHDPLHPVNFEFFALSRLGTVLFVSLLTGPLGMSADWAMRATMWLGFAGLALAAFVLVRRWTGCSRAVAAAALLLIPGVAENAFFYNDNVLSVALVTGALAVVASSRRVAPAALAGLLFGASVVARTDAVLLAPAVVLVGYGQDRLGRQFVRRGLAFAAGILVPVIAVPAAFGVTIFDVLRISNYAVLLWDRPLDLKQHAQESAIFIGIPAALLAAAGLVRLVRGREYWRLLLLAGVPLLFHAVYLGKLWQSRQMLPLTPFLAALAVCGWQALAAAPRRSPAAAARAAVVAVTVAVLFMPPARVNVSDGPRARYGRFWSPRLWTRWQSAVNTNVADLGQFAASLPAPGPAAVLTDTWNADRYLHLVLQEQGYAILRPDQVNPACAKVAEVFRKRDREILLFRLHEPFLRSYRALAAKRLESYGVPCLDAVRPKVTYLLAPVTRLAWLFKRDLPVNAWIARGLADSTLVRAGYDPQTAVLLTPPVLATLRRAYAIDAANYQRLAPARERDRFIGLAAAERLMRPQVWPQAGPQVWPRASRHVTPYVPPHHSNAPSGGDSR